MTPQEFNELWSIAQKTNNPDRAMKDVLLARNYVKMANRKR